MIFYLYVIGKGGLSAGCDYTIGCNHHLIRLKATGQSAAEQEAEQLLTDEERGYHEAESAVLLHVRATLPYDMPSLRRDKATERARRQQYEQLKAEFEGS